MAGKIVADTLEHSTAGSLDTQYVVNGSSKAWMHELHATVYDSLNVSSATDGGSGDTVMNFSSAMNNSLYANHGGGLDANIGTNSGYMGYQAAHFDHQVRTTTACNPRKGFYTSTGGFGDYISSTVIFGDLA